MDLNDKRFHDLSKRGNVSNFFVDNQFHFQKVCHAQAFYTCKNRDTLIDLPRFNANLIPEELCKNWMGYWVNDPLFGHCWETKDWKTMQSYIIMNTKVSTNMMLFAVTITRMCWEFPSLVVWWDLAMKAGFHPYIALFLGSCFRLDVKRMTLDGSNHLPVDPYETSLAKVLNVIETQTLNDTSEPYCDNLRHEYGGTVGMWKKEVNRPKSHVSFSALVARALITTNNEGKEEAPWISFFNLPNPNRNKEDNFYIVETQHPRFFKHLQQEIENNA